MADGRSGEPDPILVAQLSCKATNARKRNEIPRITDRRLVPYESALHFLLTLTGHSKANIGPENAIYPDLAQDVGRASSRPPRALTTVVAWGGA